MSILIWAGPAHSFVRFHLENAMVDCSTELAAAEAARSAAMAELSAAQSSAADQTAVLRARIQELEADKEAAEEGSSQVCCAYLRISSCSPTLSVVTWTA